MNWKNLEEHGAPKPRTTNEGGQFFQEGSVLLLLSDDVDVFPMHYGFDIDNRDTLEAMGVTHWIRVSDIPLPEKTLEVSK